MVAKHKAKQTIGSVAMDAILNGLSDEETLAAVKKAFPKASTKIASVKVYRSNLRKEVKDGSREAGLEGPPQRKVGGLIRDSNPMTEEAKEACRESRNTAKDDDWADRMQVQKERLKKMRPNPRRDYKKWAGAALRFKSKHGFWPSPNMLTEASLI